MPTLRYNPVPEVLPNVSAGDTYQRVQADANAFGAGIGAATERLAGVFETAGNRLAENALDRQNFFNQTVATEKSNYFMEQSDKLRYGDPNVPGDTGFYGKRGKEALDAFPVVRQNIDKLWQDTRGTLQNPAQQLHFDSETRRLRSYMMGELGRHYDQQFNAYQDSTGKAQVALQRTRAGRALVAGDDNEFSDAVGSGLRAVTNLVKGRGGSDEEAASDRDKFASDMVEDKIKVLSTTNPLQASRVLEANRDKINVDKYVALSNTLRIKALDQESDQVLQGTWKNEPRAGARGMIRGGAISGQIEKEAQRQNFDSNTALAVADIESSMGSNLGRRSNIFQLGEPEWASVGGGTKGDVATDIKNGVAFLATKKSEMRDALGHEPTSAEIYLAHQQGTAGATALLKNPNTPAGQLVPPQNISSNGGDPSAPASAFVAKWAGEVNRRLEPIKISSGFDLAAGDSIAVGAVRYGGVQGKAVNSTADADSVNADAAGSRNPQQGLDYITSHPERFAGKTVLWSSGLMNAGANPSASLPVVEKQLDALKAAGANVVLMGVDQGKFSQYNTALAALAESKGFAFGGPLPTDNIHPGQQGYKDYATNAAKLISAGGPDTLVGRTLPPREENEYPDEQIPGLKDTLDRLAKTIPESRPDLFNATVKKARALANMDWVMQQRARTQNQQAKKAANDNEEQDLFGKLYPEDGSPGQVTAVQIAHNSNLTPEGVTKMLSALKGSLEAEPNSALSKVTYAKLYGQMILPDGDPNKITSVDPIDQALISKQLTAADHRSLRKEFFEDMSPTGMRLKESKADFMTGYKATIDKSNPLMGDIDKDGMIQYSRFKYAVDDEIKRMRDEKKDPALLFNPKSPEYLGTPKFVDQFKKPLSESTKDVVKGMRPNPAYVPVNPASPTFAAPIPGAVAPRQPGESPEAYEKRVR